MAQRLGIQSNEDVVQVRQAVRLLAQETGMSLVETTKLVTAASELARNTLDYGGGGWVELERCEDGARRGVRLVFQDEGPGIPDVQQALRDGFSTGGGLGLGLGGSRRLLSELLIETEVGKGTRITAVRWR